MSVMAASGVSKRLRKSLHMCELAVAQAVVAVLSGSFMEDDVAVRGSLVLAMRFMASCDELASLVPCAAVLSDSARPVASPRAVIAGRVFNTLARSMSFA